MITVTFYEDNKRLEARFSGHALSAAKGEDLICASVSTLCYTLTEVCQLLEKQGFIKGKAKIHLAEGNAVIKIKPRPEHYAECANAFSVISVGCRVIERSYPQYVNFSIISPEVFPSDE